MHARGRARDGLLVRVRKTRREQRQGRRRLRRRNLQRGADDVHRRSVGVARARDERFKRAKSHRQGSSSLRLPCFLFL